MNDLIYRWIPLNPVQIPDNNLPGGFKLDGFRSLGCDVVTATGAYSCLRVELTFARQLSFFIVTIYIPCLIIVIVSWMSFWIDHKAVPARVSLGVTTLLAMSTTQASINNSLPPVAYTKAIDVWCGLCVFFVFGALLEYALVNYASRSDAQREARQKEIEEMRKKSISSFHQQSPVRDADSLLVLNNHQGGHYKKGSIISGGRLIRGDVAGGPSCTLLDPQNVGVDDMNDSYHNMDPLLRKIDGAAQIVPSCNEPILTPNFSQTSELGGFLASSSSHFHNPRGSSVVGRGIGSFNKNIHHNAATVNQQSNQKNVKMFQNSGLPNTIYTTSPSTAPSSHLNHHHKRSLPRGCWNFMYKKLCPEFLQIWGHNFQFRAKKIDVISRVLFPSMFAFFNIVYWSYYLTHEQTKMGG